MRNGYPELGALSHAIQGDSGAKDWLLNNGYPQFAALDSAIDEEKPAQEWLQKPFRTASLLSRAINNYEDALDWFQKRNLAFSLSLPIKYVSI